MLDRLRKIVANTFSSLLPSDKPHHVKFANFLLVFSYMWLFLAVSSAVSYISSIVNKEIRNEFIPILVLGLVFFFFYRYTSKILKGYTAEKASSFTYLKYLNPIAPVLYTTTILLLVALVLNLVMGIFYALGVLFYIMGILVTIGLILFQDSYKLENFVKIPKKFFRAEDYFFDNVVGPQYIIAYLVLVYIVVPFGASILTVIKHRSGRKV